MHMRATSPMYVYRATSVVHVYFEHNPSYFEHFEHISFLPPLVIQKDLTISSFVVYLPLVVYM